MAIIQVYKCDDGTTHESLKDAEAHDLKWNLISKLESFYDAGDDEFKVKACAEWILDNYNLNDK